MAWGETNAEVPVLYLHSPNDGSVIAHLFKLSTVIIAGMGLFFIVYMHTISKNINEAVQILKRGNGNNKPGNGSDSDNEDDNDENDKDDGDDRKGNYVRSSYGLRPILIIRNATKPRNASASDSSLSNHMICLTSQTSEPRSTIFAYQQLNRTTNSVPGPGGNDNNPCEFYCGMPKQNSCGMYMPFKPEPIHHHSASFGVPYYPHPQTHYEHWQTLRRGNISTWEDINNDFMKFYLE